MKLRMLILFSILAALRAHAAGPVEDFLNELFSKPDQYVALGKILTAPPSEDAAGYYGQHLRTLQSPNLLNAARRRVTKLHPESTTGAVVVIKVMRSPGSSLIRVAAIGDQQRYTRQILDALLDEFMEKISEDARTDKKDNLARLLEEFSAAEKDYLESGDKLAAIAGKSVADPAKLTQAFEKSKARYESVKDRLEKYDVAREIDQYLSVIERPVVAIPTR